MRGFTGYCSIPHSFYGLKWPKLEEAVDIICGRDDFSFHNSLADCYAVLELLKVMGKLEGDEWAKGLVDLFSTSEYCICILQRVSKMKVISYPVHLKNQCRC